jgi:hypothetical protein
MTGPIINDAEAYGVSIEPAQVGLGRSYWRVTQVHHLTPQENAGNHHIYVEVLDEYDKPVPGARLRVTWAAGEDEIVTAPPGADEAGASFAMVPGQVFSVEMLGGPSDRVVGLHADHPQEGEGNAPEQHSFRLVWQRAIKKIFSHYVLFGPPEDPKTQSNLIIALGYILRFKPAFGFKVEEAELAERVTIIGGPAAVSLDAQDRLESAGCWVYRIEGDSRSVDRLLTELQKSGRPFPQ